LCEIWVQFMSEKYLQYPSTVKELAAELNKILNDYRARKIGNEEVRNSVLWYAEACPDKLFDAEDINITVKRFLGKKRLTVLKTLLVGFQTKLK